MTSLRQRANHLTRAQRIRPLPANPPTLPTSPAKPRPAHLGLGSAQVESAREAALANADVTAMLHADASAYALLSADEERALALRMQAGDADAREQFISANVRLVAAIAQRYASRRHDPGMDFDDLMQEGMIGLMRAVDRFDPQRGNRFSTHAVWWIWQALSRAIVDRGFAIRVPAHSRERQLRLLRLRSQLEQQTGATPSLEALATRLGITPEEAREALNLPGVFLSLDVASAQAPDSTDVNRPLGEVLADPQAEAALEAIEIASPENVLSLMHALLRRQRAGSLRGEAVAREIEVLLRLIVEEQSLREAGRDLGISPQRVAQLRDRGIKRLRAERLRVRRQQKNGGAA